MVTLQTLHWWGGLKFNSNKMVQLGVRGEGLTQSSFLTQITGEPADFVLPTTAHIFLKVSFFEVLIMLIKIISKFFRNTHLSINTANNTLSGHMAQEIHFDLLVWRITVTDRSLLFVDVKYWSQIGHISQQLAIFAN